MLWEQFIRPSLKAMRTLFIRPIQGCRNTASISYLDTWVRKSGCLHLPYTSVPLLMPLVPFKLLPQCWSSEVVSLSKSTCGFFKRNCLGLQKFLSLTQSPLVFAGRRYRDLSSRHWKPGLGPWLEGLELLTPKIYLPNFYAPHMCVGPAHAASPYLCPCYQSGWMWFL